MMQNIISLIIVVFMAVELYLVAAGTEHRKKRPKKGANIVKGKITDINKKKEDIFDGSRTEMSIELESGSVIKVMSGASLFNLYQTGEEVELQEKKGVYRFLGNDRLAKRARLELAAGLIPVGVIIAINVIITLVS